MDSGMTDAPAVAAGVKMAETRERLFDFALEDIRKGYQVKQGSGKETWSVQLEMIRRVSET